MLFGLLAHMHAHPHNTRTPTRSFHTTPRYRPLAPFQNLTKDKAKVAKSPKKKKKKVEHNGECFSTTCYDHPFWYRTIGYRRFRITIWQFLALVTVFIVALSAGIASIPPPPPLASGDSARAYPRRFAHSRGSYSPLPPNTEKTAIGTV